MNDKYEILAQNCLALAIDRCEKVGLPLKVKRQRMIIKGAIRQMLEEERLVEKLEAVRLLESLVPSGSEFAGSPEACARWVRERLASVGKLAAERNLLGVVGKALAETARSARSNLEAFRAQLKQTEPDEVGRCPACGPEDYCHNHGLQLNLMHLISDIEAALADWKEATE